jgi:predicted metal-binding membrane protein
MGQGAGRRLLDQVRWVAWAHPQFWVAGICVAAWLLLLTTPHVGSEPDAYCGIRAAGRAASASTSEMLQWITMVVAMMFPLVLAQVRTIALSSAWRRRHLAMGWFLCAQLAVWLLARVCCDVLTLCFARISFAMPSLAGAGLAAGALATAALWHFTPIKRRAAARCHRRTPVPMSGWRADLACLRHGVRNGLDCVISCWPAMLAMILVPYSLGFMAVVSCLVLADRYLWPIHRRLLPLAYVSTATGCVIGSLVK